MAINKFDGKYRFLSNFWLAPVVIDGVRWPTSEHAYQAAKFTSHEVRNKILDNPDPKKAKTFGKSKGMRPDWDTVKLSIMEDIVKSKFQQHPDLAKDLKNTSPQELIEGNWWNDTFWGVCKGKGENHLGKILMKIREEL